VPLSASAISRHNHHSKARYNMEVCERWSPIDDIHWPAADICFAYEAPSVATARLGFSSVSGGSAQDLVLHFSNVIALRYEAEAPGLIPLPKNLPKLAVGIYPAFTYPLLEVRDSDWLAEYSAFNPEAALHHYVLVSLNDLLHVLAGEKVEASWVNPVA
jgi:hypothetical protein